MSDVFAGKWILAFHTSPGGVDAPQLLMKVLGAHDGVLVTQQWLLPEMEVQRELQLVPVEELMDDMSSLALYWDRQDVDAVLKDYAQELEQVRQERQARAEDVEAMVAFVQAMEADQ